MRGLLAIAAGGVIGVVAAGALAGQHLAPQPVRVDKVKDDLYVVRGPFLPCSSRSGCGPNTFDDGLLHEPGDVAVRVTPEGVILVDDKYPENVADVMEKVRSITSQPVRYILNTHHHADHASGNANLLDMPIDIIAHRNVRENFIRTKQPGAPRVVFNDEAAVHLGGVEVRLLYLGRGHTNGDTVIYFPDLRTIHAGDLVIDGMPYIDYEGGGSAIEWVGTLRNMLKIDFDTVIPGHGGILTREYVVDRIQKLETMNQRMRELVRKRVPRDQLASQLKIDDLGWSHTVSTGGFMMRSIGPYYDEMAAAQ